MIEWYKGLEFEKWIDFVNRNRNDLRLLEGLYMGSLVDYSDLKDEIENAPEPTILPAGTEILARITSVRTGTSDKNDCEWFMPTFDYPDDPMVKEFSDFFWVLDKEKLSSKDYARALYKFKKFAKAFAVDLSRPFDYEDDLPGKTGWLIVGVRKSKEYGEQNSVTEYSAGK